MNIQAITNINAVMPGRTEQIDAPIGLEGRAISSLAQMMVSNDNGKRKLNQVIINPEVALNPQIALSIQKQLEEYTLTTSVVSSLAKKAVSTIETLIKT